MSQTSLENKSISRFAHICSRIAAYSNWYALIWPFNRIGSEGRVIRTWGGVKIYVRSIFGPDWVVAHEMFSRDDYQIARLPLSGQSIILDIGANIGAFTVFASYCFRDAKIFSYEPAATNFEVLKKNIDLNALEGRVRPFQLAVSVKTGEEIMTYSDQEYEHSLIANQVDLAHVLKSEKVMCTTIADIIADNKLDIVDLIKMDIVGLEYEILYALSEDTFKKIRYIALEIHDHKKHAAGDLIKFLEQKGFTVVRSPKHVRVYMATNNNSVKK